MVGYRIFRLGTFNVKRKGEEAAHRKEELEIAAEVLRPGFLGSAYDIFLFQEIVNPDFTRALAEQIRLDRGFLRLDRGFPYDYLYGDAEHNAEYYVFFYNPITVQIIDTWQFPDTQKKFFRPPYVGIFEIKGHKVAIVNIHTSPKKIRYKGKQILRSELEVPALRYVTAGIRQRFGVRDIIIAGDLNLHPPYGASFGFKKGMDFPGLVPTNVGGDLSLDHIVFDDSFYSGVRMISARINTLDFGFSMSLYSLVYPERAEDIIDDHFDHYPLEARFAIGPETVNFPSYLPFNLYVRAARMYHRLKLMPVNKRENVK